MKATDLAYIAGIVDGEGYVGIKKARPNRKTTGRVNSAYHERIQIRMVDEGAIKFVTSRLGGCYWPEDPHAAKGRPLFCYQANDLQAAKILTRLLPYLRVKRRVAKVVLQLRKMKDRQGPGEQVKKVRMRNRWGTASTFKRRRLSPRQIATRDRLWSRCKKINHGD